MKAVNGITSVVLAMAPYILSAQQAYDNTLALNSSELIARNTTSNRRDYENLEPVEQKPSMEEKNSYEETRPLARLDARLDHKIMDILKLKSYGLEYKPKNIDLGFVHLDKGEQSKYANKYDAINQIKNMSFLDYNKKKSLLYEQHYPLNRKIELILEEEITPKFRKPELGIYATIRYHLN